MDVVEARRILKVFGENLQRIKYELKVEFPPSMAPITTDFFFDQLECAMENIECRDYDLERLIKSETASTDLELMIDEAYGNYLEEKRAKEQDEVNKLKKVIEEKKEKFTARLLEVIPKNIYDLLDVQVFCDSADSMAGAKIDYRNVKILITRSQSQELWTVQVEERPGLFDSMRHIKSESLVKCLLVNMGKIRERTSNVNGYC